MTPHFLSLCSHRMPQPVGGRALHPYPLHIWLPPPPGRWSTPTLAGGILRRWSASTPDGGIFRMEKYFHFGCTQEVVYSDDIFRRWSTSTLMTYSGGGVLPLWWHTQEFSSLKRVIYLQYIYRPPALQSYIYKNTTNNIIHLLTKNMSLFLQTWNKNLLKLFKIKFSEHCNNWKNLNSDGCSLKRWCRPTSTPTVLRRRWSIGWTISTPVVLRWWNTSILAILRWWNSSIPVVLRRRSTSLVSLLYNGTDLP